MVEIEQSIQRACDRVARAVADGRQSPVGLDEADHGRLIRQAIIDKVGLRPGRDHQQRQAWAEAAAIGPI